MTASPMVVAPSSADQRRRAGRAGRYGARHWLWANSAVPRVRACGRSMAGNAHGVALRVTGAGEDRHAGYSGLQHCGSVWACPVCAAKIAEGRAQQIGAVVAQWFAQGGKVAHVTLTVRHEGARSRLGRFLAGDSLEKVWDGVSKGWARATSGGDWKDAGEAYSGGGGKIRFIRAVEVLHGRNGWHVHVHAMLLLDGAVTDAEAGMIAGNMWDRWNKGAQSAGLRSGLRRVGVAVRLVAPTETEVLADYFVKSSMTLAREATRSDLKTRSTGRTPWEILRGLVDRDAGVVGATAPKSDDRLWREYERASRGRRQMTASSGLWEEFGTVDVDDQSLADEQAEGEDVLNLRSDEWAEVIRRRADWVLLWLAETSTREHLYAFLAELICRDDLLSAPPDRDPDERRLPTRTGAEIRAQYEALTAR